MKGLSVDSQIHISLALLIKAAILITVVVASWYQAQMRFASIESRMNDMHEELVTMTSKVHAMETKHINALEEENRSLMEKLGLKRK